jgi:hypothetical protein
LRWFSQRAKISTAAGLRPGDVASASPPDATGPGLWGSDSLTRATRRPFLILRPVHRGRSACGTVALSVPGIRRPFGPLNSAGEGWRMLARASVSLPNGLGESVRLRPSFERKLLMRATFSTGGEEGAATASTPPPSKLPPACCGARNHAPALIVSKIPTATGGPDGVALPPKCVSYALRDERRDASSRRSRCSPRASRSRLQWRPATAMCTSRPLAKASQSS